MLYKDVNIVNFLRYGKTRITSKILTAKTIFVAVVRTVCARGSSFERSVEVGLTRSVIAYVHPHKTTFSVTASDSAGCVLYDLPKEKGTRSVGFFHKLNENSIAGIRGFTT